MQCWYIMARLVREDPLREAVGYRVEHGTIQGGVVGDLRNDVGARIKIRVPGARLALMVNV